MKPICTPEDRPWSYWPDDPNKTLPPARPETWAVVRVEMLRSGIPDDIEVEDLEKWKHAFLSVLPRVFGSIYDLQISPIDVNRPFLTQARNSIDWLLKNLRGIINKYILESFQVKYPGLPEREILNLTEYQNELESPTEESITRVSTIGMTREILEKFRKLLPRSSSVILGIRSIELGKKTVKLTELRRELLRGMLELIEFLIPDLTDKEIQYIWGTSMTLDELRRFHKGEDIPSRPPNQTNTQPQLAPVTAPAALAKTVASTRTAAAAIPPPGPGDSFPPTSPDQPDAAA